MGEEWIVESLVVADGEKPGYQFDPLSQKVIGVAITVQRKLGPGFREDLYENALKIEFAKLVNKYQP